MPGPTAWEPGSAELLVGVELDTRQFVAKMPVALLVAYVRDPSGADEYVETEDEIAPHPLLSAPNRRNVQQYVKYILDNIPDRDTEPDDEQDGILPPIVLWTEQPLEIALVSESGLGTKALVLPYRTRLEALAGRTQVAAWHEIAAQRREKRDTFLAVTIHHSRPSYWARRAFASLQTQGARTVSAPVVGDGGDDSLDALLKHVRDGVDLFRGRISPRRQLGPDDPEVLTEATLRTACATFALGIGGVQKTAHTDESLEAARDETLKANAVFWFKLVAERFHSEFEPARRKGTILPTPAAMAAIGAEGHRLTHGKDQKRATAASVMGMMHLEDIRWSRGAHWEGIAGKMGPKGLSVGGGAREYAYQIFHALMDSDSPGYKRVRQEHV